eukprot:9791988-Alexandrium_andersonii.AAC.1
MCIRDRNRRKSETPISAGPCARGAAFRAAPCAWQCNRKVFDPRQFGAAERAVWPSGCAGTAAASGWISGPELVFTT